MMSSTVVNIVVPLLLFFVYFALAKAFTLVLKSRELAMGFALAVPMALPYIVSGILRQPVGTGFLISAFFTLAWIVFLALKQLRCSKVKGVEFFDKTELLSILFVVFLCGSLLLPGIYTDGYFIPNANFDFIYQTVDSRYMYLHQPTVFNPTATGAADLPLSWFANEQGRYLSSVLQAVVSSYIFGGDYLAGSISVFVFFYFVYIVATYCVIEAAGLNRLAALLVTLVVAMMPYFWLSIRYMLIGQLSALPVFLFILAALLKRPMSLLEDKSIIVLCGLLCLIYFALGFVACAFIAAFILLAYRTERIEAKKTFYTVVALGAIPLLIYFSPYSSSPNVAISVVLHWFEVIFSKMYSTGNVAEVSVDYLSELVSLRILGVDISPFLPKLLLLSDFWYFLIFALSLALLALITYLVVRLPTKINSVKALWFTYLVFCVTFYVTQGGYLLFKILSYMAIAPVVVYISVFLNSKRAMRVVLAIILLVGGVLNAAQTLSLAGAFSADRFGARFTPGVGGSSDYVQLVQYLKKETSKKRLWLNLSNPAAQAFVLLGAGNFTDNGVKNNYQILENSRWSDNACDFPSIKEDDLVVVNSIYSPIHDGRPRDVYRNPEFENSTYAVVKMKNVERLSAFSRGFYGPEPANFDWNHSFNIGRWSSGRSAVVFYNSKPENFQLKVLAFNGLGLKISHESKVLEYALPASPSFQPLALGALKSGWNCVQMSGNGSVLNSSFNRLLFRNKNLDSRPIKYMVTLDVAD